MSAQDVLNAAALDYAVAQGYTAPTPTPAPEPVFDGRASRLTLLQSYETTPGTLSTLVQKQSPAVWDGLSFLQNDITLVPDAHYGQVYDVKVNGGSHNPYYTPTDGRSSELSVRRAMILGVWDWYVNAYKVVAPFSQPDWCTVDQFGYPSLSSPPLGVYIDAGHFNLHQYAGQFTAGQSRPSGPIAQNDIQPVVLGEWLEFIVGVKWATDSTGAVQVHTRVPGAGWLKKVDKTGFATAQWGTVGANTIPASYIDSSGHPFGVIDHGGLYYGYYSAPPLPSPFPANHVQRLGLARWASLADAKASLG